MTRSPTMLVRADVSPQIGVGHVMRCLALAQEWQSHGGRVVYASNQLTSSARRKLEQAGISIVELESGGRALRLAADQENAQWIVMDVGAQVHDYLIELDGYRTLVIDDLGGDFTAVPTLLLNQNIHAQTTIYRGIPPHRLKLGLDYLLLRDEFLRYQPTPRIPATCRDVLVTLGGTDPLGLTPEIAGRLCEALDAEIHVVATGDHTRLTDLEDQARLYRNLKLHVDVSDMAALMSSMDLAITSGGTTVWELAYMGVPSVVGTVSILEARLARGLVDLGLFRVFGPFREGTIPELVSMVRLASADQQWRRSTSALARRIIDGRGRQRIMLELFTGLKGASDGK